MFIGAPLARDGPDGSNAVADADAGIAATLRLTPNGAGAPAILCDHVAAARGSFVALGGQDTSHRVARLCRTVGDTCQLAFAM